MESPRAVAVPALAQGQTFGCRISKVGGGWVVVDTPADSLAHRLGLRTGDRILEVDGAPVSRAALKQAMTGELGRRTTWRVVQTPAAAAPAPVVRTKAKPSPSPSPSPRSTPAPARRSASARAPVRTPVPAPAPTPAPRSAPPTRPAPTAAKRPAPAASAPPPAKRPVTAQVVPRPMVTRRGRPPARPRKIIKIERPEATTRRMRELHQLIDTDEQMTRNAVQILKAKGDTSATDMAAFLATREEVRGMALEQGTELDLMAPIGKHLATFALARVESIQTKPRVGRRRR